jgi:hypothetical protein
MTERTGEEKRILPLCADLGVPAPLNGSSPPFYPERPAHDRFMTGHQYPAMDA